MNTKGTYGIRKGNTKKRVESGKAIQRKCVEHRKMTEENVRNAHIQNDEYVHFIYLA